MKSNRKTLLGGLVVATLALAGASPADAGQRSARVSDRLDRIEVQINGLREIRDPYVRNAEVDRLQHKLDRLGARSSYQRGRLARYNDDHIAHLQRRLARIERRTDRKIAYRERRHAKPYRAPQVVYVPRPRFGLVITDRGVRVGVDHGY